MINIYHQLTLSKASYLYNIGRPNQMKALRVKISQIKKKTVPEDYNTNILLEFLVCCCIPRILDLPASIIT